MASRFWVGGTGTWDAATTTHWAASSGGAGGASVPGSTDAVFFDGASGGGTTTLSVDANVASLDCTGYAGTIATAGVKIILSGATANVTLGVGMTLTSNAGVNSLSWGSSAVGTLTTNGVSIPNFNVGGGAAGGTVTLGDACTVSGTVTLTSGTLNTNGKTCTWGSFNANNANTRTITLGASPITVSGTGIAWDCTTATGLTVTASSATITMTGANPTFRTGSKNWPTLIFNGFTSTAIISGSGSTFANITVTGPANKNGALNMSSGSWVVTGTLTLTGNSLVNRLLFNGNGLPANLVTITAAAVSLSNTDFSDVAGAGAAAPFTGTSLGDALGNSGITFTAPVTRFAVAAGNWSSTATWSASSGGAPGASVPLPQDTVKLNAAAGAGTYTADVPRIGKDIDFTGFAQTYTQAIQVTYYGAWTASVGMTWSGSGGIVCFARSTVLFTSAAQVIPTGLTMGGVGGTMRLADNLSAGANAAVTLVLNDGTFDANGKNVTFGLFAATSGRARTLILGSGTWTLIGVGTVWNVSATLQVVTPGTAIIDITDTSASTKTFTGGGFAYPTLRYRSAGTGALAINGGNTFANLDVECSSARQLILQGGQTQLVLAALTIAGTAAATLSLLSSAPGSQAGLWVAIGGTMTQAFTSLSADVVLTAGQNLAQIDAITDATRAAAAAWGTGQTTGQADGAAIPGGFYVGRTATNLHRRGQCDVIADQGLSAATIAIDATTPPPFSTQSFKITQDGTASPAGVSLATSTGLALAAATLCPSGIWVKGVAGQGYVASPAITNTDATDFVGSNVAFTATGVWQWIPLPGFAVAAGKTGDKVRIRIFQSATRLNEVFWVAHAMLESGHATVAPYVPTSGGATSTRQGGRLQVGVASSPTQFWWAARIVMGFSAADTELFRSVAAWETATGSDGFQLTFRTSSPRWKMQITSNNVSQNATVAAAGFTNPGDSVLVVGQASYNAGTNQWTLSLSVNGAAFTSTVCTVGFVPTLPELPYFDIGNIRGAQQIDSQTSWFASGLGYTLTDSDAAALALLPAHDPSFAGLSAALRASVNALAPMDTVAYEVPLSVVSVPVLS